MERFIGYLRYSFFVPLMSSFHATGLQLDAETANGEVRKWLNQVANVRTRRTTHAVPQLRWLAERAQLLPLPPAYPGRALESVPPMRRWPTVPPLQHPLSVYDELLTAEAP